MSSDMFSTTRNVVSYFEFAVNFAEMPVEAGKKYWRANRFIDFKVGAKDLSNHRIAGSFWSFPQDSENSALWIVQCKDKD